MFDLSIFTQEDFVLFFIILILAVSALILSRKLLKVSFPYIFLTILGLIIGLIISALISSPLSRLPGNFGRWLPIIFSVFIVVAILDLFLAQAKSLNLFFHKILHLKPLVDFQNCEIIIDTSILIDGRIKEIAESGFIMGKMIVPKSVLKELQKISDSSNPIKRAKGRRGIEVLTNLQKNPKIIVEIIEEPENMKGDTDSRLVQLAKERKNKIMTSDFNLNQIAQVQGVDVLNINQLSESLKPALLPGEEISVKIIQKGKEKDQGVGYLPDGTMIVVEQGDKYVGQILNCEVIRIYQTVAGKIIFVRPK